MLVNKTNENKMAQRKETKTKTKIKIQDLKPKKDAKGGFMVFGQTRNQQVSGSGKPSGPGKSPDRFI
jgi:hypothetical protein